MKINPDLSFEFSINDVTDLLNFIGNLIVKKKETSLKDVIITNGCRNSIDLHYPNEEGYVYSTNLDINFSGNFGKKPKIYMVYSHNSHIVNFDERELIDKNIIESKVGLVKYKFRFSRQYSYLNNTSTTVKPYLIIVEGRYHIGMGYIISKEKAFSLIQKEKNGFRPVPFQNPGVFSEYIKFEASLNDVLQYPEIKKDDIKGFAEIENIFKDCFFNHNK